METVLAAGPGKALKWLESQLDEIQHDRENLEKNIHRLEREKELIERHLPDPKNMQRTLEHIFLNFDAAEPSVRRTFFRQIFDRIEVTDDNEVKLNWRFSEMKSPPPAPRSGPGGNGFAYRLNWGNRRGLNPRHPESQSGALPTELRLPLENHPIEYGLKWCMPSPLTLSIRLRRRAPAETTAPSLAKPCRQAAQKPAPKSL